MGKARSVVVKPRERAGALAPPPLAANLWFDPWRLGAGAFGFVSAGMTKRGETLRANDAAQPARAGRDVVVVQPARDVAQYLIELYLRFPPDRETGLALRRYDEMLCQTYPHIAAMMTNKNTRLLRAGRYLPYRTLSAWARGKQSNGGIL